MIANYRQAVQVAEPEPPEPEINFVEYIQSSGTQYIDTGFKPNNNTRVVMDIQATKTGTWGCFGARKNNRIDSFTVWMTSTTAFRSDFDSDQNQINVSSVLNRVVIDKNKNICKVGTKSTTNTSVTFQAPVNLLLLAVNHNGEPDGRNLSAKLYSCQIYDNDILIRDYAPVIDPDGVPCLYEKLSEQYVYNSGTGSFTAPS